MIGTLILFPMMLLTTFDVIARNVFNRPIPGTYEASEYLLVVIILFGIGYVQQRDAQVRVDMFINMMPRKIALSLEVIYTIIGLCFFALVVWQGIVGTFHSVEQGEISTILNIPSYPFEFLIAFGSFLLCLELFVKLMKLLFKREFDTGKTEVIS